MEKQLIDDIKQILIESTYFVAYIQGTEKTPTAQEMLNWKRLAICMYMDNPRFMNLVDEQTIKIMQKIEEYEKKKYPCNCEHTRYMTNWGCPEHGFIDKSWP